MSVRIYTGKPGGGKTFGALQRDIKTEIVEGDRLIVTNIAILRAELAAYVAENYPKSDFDINKRLVVVTDHENMKRFYLIRSTNPDEWLSMTSEEDQKRGRFPDFGPKAGNGVLYVIDEAHVLFDARCWATNGLTLTYYNSQHRKLNDDVIFITQFLALLDKRCVGFAQSVHVFRNTRMEKFLTYFRAPTGLTGGTLQETVYPRPPVRNDPYEEQRTYPLDLKLAKCYDTSAGVGISGRNKPDKDRVKGLSAWWLVLFAAAAVVALNYVSDIPVWYVNRSEKLAGARKGLFGKPDVGQKQPASAPSAAFPATYSGPAYAPPFPPPQTRSSAVSAPLRCYGVARAGSRVNVILSDGRVLDEESPELGQIGRNYVVVSGERVPMASRPQPVGAGGVVRPQLAQPEGASVAVTERPASRADPPPPDRGGSESAAVGGPSSLAAAESQAVTFSRSSPSPSVSLPPLNSNAHTFGKSAAGVAGKKARPTYSR